MRARIKYMSENGYIRENLNLYDEYSQTSNNSDTIKILAIKYNLSHNDNILLRIQNLLCCVVRSDEEILGRLLENIISI